MSDRTTDGAGSSTVDPSKSEVWDDVLNEAVSSIGIDPNASMELLEDPIEVQPQTDDTGSSATPVATPRAPAGDDGAATEAVVGEPVVDAVGEPVQFTGPNGESIPFDGAMRYKGEGVYIPESHVPQFEALGAQAHAAAKQASDLAAQTRTWERLTQWDVKQPDESIRTITGPQAVLERNIATASARTEARMLREILNDPAKFNALVTYQDGGDGKFYAIPDPEKLAHLADRVQLAIHSATNEARQFVLGRIPAPPAAEPTIESRADGTVESLLQHFKVADLSKEDRALIAGQISAWTRPATAQERVTLKSSVVIDPNKAEPLIRRLASAQQAIVKATETANTAAMRNAATNAGRAQQRPARASTQPAPVVAGQKVGKQQAWDDVLNAAMQEITM